jgi:hypothetical protein
LVTTLEELHDVLVQIDNRALDQRYVDFWGLAKRLEECIEKIQDPPAIA